MPSTVFLLRYFDRGGCGYIKGDDLKRLLGSLGIALPHSTVKDLVSAAVDASSRSSSGRGGGGSSDRIYYRDLTDVEVPQPLSKKPKEEAKEEPKEEPKEEAKATGGADAGTAPDADGLGATEVTLGDNVAASSELEGSRAPSFDVVMASAGDTGITDSAAPPGTAAGDEDEDMIPVPVDASSAAGDGAHAAVAAVVEGEAELGGTEAPTEVAAGEAPMEQ